ncbi:penicillin-binding protein [Prevotella sp. PCHR]|uniref:Penicillin-binding protein n=2 Tax=Xylanibacter caecicola TaxID=2736294 RepID=A0ABX2B1N7_9BACT|nr:transglycosylase domain-containing protein [Xylanibacter caecicola]NPE25392.1 penicillin-binding protein [Xylanibacter caecicola]
MFEKVKVAAELCRRKIAGLWSWYKNLYKGRAWYTKTIIVICSLIISLIIYLVMVDINFLWLFGKSPGFSQIKNPQTNEASEIYSSDGVLIGKYFNQNRTPVKYEDVNPIFWKTLIDTEDERFYSHFGIDITGLFAAVKDMIVHHDARGASTITQQLAKNMFRVRTQYSTGLLGHIPGVRMLIMKSKEWIIATKLELIYDKKDIITMYANTVDFSSNAYGIKTACKTYFGITPAEMTAEQAAVLVGMLKATTAYNPISNPKNSLKRRNVVLHNMLKHNDLTRAEYDSIIQIPIKLNFSIESNYDGQAQYFREAVADELKDWCNDNGYDLYTSGLKIYTTIDTRMQKYAEEAAIKQMKQVQRNFNNHWSGQDPWRDEKGQVIPNFIENIAKRQPVYKALQLKYDGNEDSIKYYMNKPHTVKLFDYENGVIEKEMSTMDSIRYMVHFMHCSFLAMEPQTGEVKAWVGDLDFKSWKYDKVTAMRQPGSTFKLFVYTEAMNQGLTPCDKRRDEYIRMEVYDKKKGETTIWTPTNANGRFSGDSIPLRSAFARSINSVAVRLGQEMGIKNIINTAHEMGIKSPLDEAPSLALGASDVNLLEMVNAYCTIANNGKHVSPVLVTRIIDKDGKEIYKAQREEKQAIPYKSAFFMQQLLMGGMREPGGTSQSLWSYIGSAPDTDFGGKTGTTNNHSDAWFMCVSPNLVAGAWVGGEYRSIHFRTGALGQGSRTALPICGNFIQAVMSDAAFAKYHGKFRTPDDTDIKYGMYSCASYVPVRNDTVSTDTTDVVTENESNVVEDENAPETDENTPLDDWDL